MILRLVGDEHSYLSPSVHEQDYGTDPKDQDQGHDRQLLDSKPVAVFPLQGLDLVVRDLGGDYGRVRRRRRVGRGRRR